MQITVNGTSRQAPEGQSLLALLQDLKLNPATTIVELNRRVIDRGTFSEITLSDGDRLELVRLVGGG